MILAYNTTFARSYLSNRLTACRLKIPFVLQRVSDPAAGTILCLASLTPSHLRLPVGRHPYSNPGVILVT